MVHRNTSRYQQWHLKGPTTNGAEREKMASLFFLSFIEFSFPSFFLFDTSLSFAPANCVNYVTKCVGHPSPLFSLFQFVFFSFLQLYFPIDDICSKKKKNANTKTNTNNNNISNNLICFSIYFFRKLYTLFGNHVSKLFCFLIAKRS